MSDSRLDLPINKGLLDAWSVGRTLVDLKERFYPVEFFDLCSIIEEIVLRDEIVLVGKYEMLPRDYRAALHPFVANGVFRTVIVSTTILKTDVVDDTLRSSSLRARSQGLTNATLKDADYSVTRLLGAEIDLRVPTIALLQHLHNYHFVRRPALDNAICDIAGRYRDLKQRAEAAKALDYGRLGLKQIGVPPIALQVMQRARTYEQLAQEILQVRHEYRVTRQTMRNLTEMLIDPDLSSAELYRLVTLWESQWRKLVDAVPSCSLRLGHTAEPLLRAGVELAKSSSSGSVIESIGACMRLILHLPDLVGLLALRPMHLSVNNYLLTHPHRMIRSVSRIFAQDPKVIRRQMEAVGSSTTTVWRQALSRLR